MIKNFKWLLLLSLSITACSSDDDKDGEEIVITSGSADFSNYVALGDSFAAGYSDNALFKAGQDNSYPSILSRQFALAGGGDFTIPYMADDLGGFSMGGMQMPQFPTRLYFNAATSTPMNVSGISATVITDHVAGPINNLGVPGAKSFHLLAQGYGQANPYFGRFASAVDASVLGDAAAQAPTFFSLWIGGNDVLAYAISGGSGVNQTGNTNPATYGSSDITDPGVFAFTYSTIVNKLTENGAKGVVANLPYINALPYFTTVPFNPIPLDANTAALLNSNNGFGQYNAGIQYVKSLGLISEAEAARRTISFHAGAGNAVVMTDSYLTNLTALGIPSYRQATAEDFIVLPARAFIGTQVNGNPLQVNGVSVPLADNWVLSKEEVAEVRVATDAYNATIEAVANEKGLALVDTKTILTQLANGGVVDDSFTLTSTYVTGGTFSLDGIHPSPRGYAFIANMFVDAINAKYGSNMQGVNLGDYRILYPQAFQ